MISERLFNNTVILLCVLVVIFALVMTGCAPPSNAPTRDTSPSRYDMEKVSGNVWTGGVYRFVDSYWNTVCYVSTNGIACVPLSATGLDF